MNDPQLIELIAHYRQVARDAPSAARDAQILQALDAFTQRRRIRIRRQLAFALAASLLLAGIQWQQHYAVTDRAVRNDVPIGYLDGRTQTFLLQADATSMATSPTAQYLLLAHAQPAD